MAGSGWGVVFNLLWFLAGRQNEAFCVEYDSEGAQAARLMSPRLTTIILAAFWLNNGLMMVAELNG